MDMCNCGNCTSKNLGIVAGRDASNDLVYLVICWNCGEIGQWAYTRREAMETWNRAGGGWEGVKGVVHA